MVRNSNWIVIGSLSAVLMGVFTAGCSTQNTNPDNSPTAPKNQGSTTSTTPRTNPSGISRPGDDMSGRGTGSNMPGTGAGDHMSGRGTGNNMSGTGTHGNMDGMGNTTHPGTQGGANGQPMTGGGMSGGGMNGNK